MIGAGAPKADLKKLLREYVDRNMDASSKSDSEERERLEAARAIMEVEEFEKADEKRREAALEAAFREGAQAQELAARDEPRKRHESKDAGNASELMPSSLPANWRRSLSGMRPRRRRISASRKRKPVPAKQALTTRSTSSTPRRLRIGMRKGAHSEALASLSRFRNAPGSSALASPMRRPHMKMSMETVTYDDYYHYFQMDKDETSAAGPRLPTADPFELLRRAHSNREVLRKADFKDTSPTESWDGEMDDDGKGKDEERSRRKELRLLPRLRWGMPPRSPGFQLPAMRLCRASRWRGGGDGRHEDPSSRLDAGGGRRCEGPCHHGDIKTNVRDAIKDDIGANFGRMEARMEAMFGRNTAALMEHSTKQKKEMNDEVDNQKKEIINIVNVRARRWRTSSTCWQLEWPPWRRRRRRRRTPRRRGRATRGCRHLNEARCEAWRRALPLSNLLELASAPTRSSTTTPGPASDVRCPRLLSARRATRPARPRRALSLCPAASSSKVGVSSAILRRA